MNRFEDTDERELEILKIDAALEQKQIERVQALRARRDSAAVESALARLKQGAAEADTNLMPAIIDASRAYVTMGEMCDALRETLGRLARDAGLLDDRVSQGTRHRAGCCRGNAPRKVGCVR